MGRVIEVLEATFLEIDGDALSRLAWARHPLRAAERGSSHDRARPDRRLRAMGASASTFSSSPKSKAAASISLAARPTQLFVALEDLAGPGPNEACSSTRGVSTTLLKGSRAETLKPRAMNVVLGGLDQVHGRSRVAAWPR
jgi:hypothetical protein